MPTINNLNKSITDMTNDELRDRIAEIRKSRRLRKAPIAKPKKEKKDKLSKEQAEALLKMLEETRE